MSSKRRIRRRSCGYKKRHKNIDGAWVHIRNLRSSGSTENYHPYKCKFCGGWHVGRLTKDIKKIIKNRFGY